MTAGCKTTYSIYTVEWQEHRQLQDQVTTDEVTDPNYADRNVLTRRFQDLRAHVEPCWQRWQFEYLTSLRERYNYITKEPHTVPKVGDIVMIHEDCPRSKWKLGKITELISGRDSINRSAKLQTRCGTSMRPIEKLYPLEVSAQELSFTQEPSTTEPMVRRTRDPTIPRRAATIKAHKLFKERL